MSRKITDEQIIEALLMCDTQAEAAKKLGITEQTICKRWKNAEFTQKYHAVQNELLRATTRKLSRATGRSADLLIKTLNDEEAPLVLRLNLAKDILRMSRDYISIDELQRRISIIEYNDQVQADEEENYNLSDFIQHDMN